MTTSPLRPPWLLATLTCAILGLITYFAIWPITFNFQDVDQLPDDYVIPRLIFLTIQLPAGVLSLVGLPFVLRGTREDHESYPYHHYVVSALTITLGTFSALGGYAGLLAVIELASRRSMRWTVLATIAASCGAVISIYADPDATDRFLTLLFAGAVIIACLLMGIWTSKRRLAEAAVWHEAQLNARHDERLRIARDMHDSLTHRLSLISVHAGVLELRNDLSSPERSEQAAIIQKQAAEAVADLQEVLRVLRTKPEQVDPRLGVRELVDQAARAGMTVALTTTPEADHASKSLSTTARHTVHRMVQECLTNARKHAPNTPVQVSVEAHDGFRVAVSNPSQGQPTSAGVGLIGLRERAELCGGKLIVESNPFTVTLELP